MAAYIVHIEDLPQNQAPLDCPSLGAGLVEAWLPDLSATSYLRFTIPFVALHFD